MKGLLIALLAVPAYAAGPFLIFASDAAYTDPATLGLAQKYLSSQDYLGSLAVAREPQLKGIVPLEHQVEVNTSVAGLQTTVRRGCNPPAAALLYYQLNDTAANPGLADLPATIRQAAALVNSTGCHQFGLMPEAMLFNSTRCSTRLDSTLYQQVDWSRIAFLDITGNWLLGSECAGKSTMQDYVTLVQAIAGYVRERNPRIVLTAHLSFGSIQPSVMVEAARATSGIVDGFLIAYPLSPEHLHEYSTASNLEVLFSSLRPHP